MPPELPNLVSIAQIITRVCNYWRMHAGSQKQVFSPLDLTHSYRWIIAAYFCYWFVTVVFVVLLCVRIQPSCSRYYTHALLWTQLLLMSVAQLQDGTWQVKCNTEPLINGSIKEEPLLSECPRNFWWLVVMATYFFFWAFMFVYVPANMGLPMWMCYIFGKTPASKDGACRSCIKGYWFCVNYCCCCCCKLCLSDRTPVSTTETAKPRGVLARHTI